MKTCYALAIFLNIGDQIAEIRETYATAAACRYAAAHAQDGRRDRVITTRGCKSPAKPDECTQ